MNSFVRKIIIFLGVIYFSVFSLLGITVFPDIMLVLVLANPPAWAQIVVSLIFPLCLFVFGIMFFFSERFGSLGLSAIAMVYGVMHVWALFELPIWEFMFEHQLTVEPGLIEFKVIGGMVILFVLSVYMLRLGLRSQRGGERSRS